MVCVLALKKLCLIFIVFSTQCSSYVRLYSVCQFDAYFLFAHSMLLLCLLICLLSVCPLNVYSMSTCSTAHSMFARSMLILCVLFKFLFSVFPLDVYSLFGRSICLFYACPFDAHFLFVYSMLTLSFSTQHQYSVCSLDAHF
jgi:hypothetical protein